MNRSRRVSLLVCGIVLVAAGSMAWGKAPWSFRDNRKVASQEKTATAAGQQQQQGKSSLNYMFGAGWGKVLNRLAAEHGLTMVMDRMPPGRFTRRDRGQYKLVDSMRILNKQLAQHDFRLMRQGDFLVLMHLRSTRTRYTRQRVPQPHVSQPPPVVPASRPGYRSETHTIRTARPGRLGNTATASNIRTVADAKSAPERMTRLPITPRHRSALQLSRRLYMAFLSHSELIDASPGRLPAFRVMNRAVTRKGEDGVRPVDPEAVTRFTVEIDTKNNQLVLEAPHSTSMALVRMIRLLDVPNGDKQPQLSVRKTRKNTEDVAAKVRPVIKSLVDDGTSSSPRDQALSQLAQRGKAQTKAQPKAQRKVQRKGQPKVQRKGQPKVQRKGQPKVQPKEKSQPTRRGQPPIADQPRDDFEPTEAILGGLKGQVKIEVLPDGRLVVIGNEADVEKVMSLINLLEAGSAPTVPEFELIFLEHVNSEALALLLNNVYASLGTARSQSGQRTSTVTVVPLIKPNAMLVLAAESDLEGVILLAKDLDRPVDPATEFEVFHLEHASAAQVATMLEDLYQEGQERPGLATRVTVYPDVRTNSIVVQARPRDLVEVTELVRRIDRDSAKTVNQLKVFQLKHAVAEELSDTMNLAIQSVINPARLPTGAGIGGLGGGGAGGAQAAQQLRDVRSAVIELMPEAGSKEAKVVSGILADIRINPDPRTNSLVVTAPVRSMKMMAQLIARLDKPTSLVADIKHFLLENADATSVSDLLEELFVTDSGGGQGGQLGVQLAGAEDASSSIVPLRFSVDVRTNSIFAVGGREALDVVEAVVARLDQSDIRQRRTEIYAMRNKPAIDIANAVNAFLQSQRDLQQIDPDLVSPFEQIEREVIVVGEPQTNSLIISATPRYYDEIMKMIEALDRAAEQVTVQALIVEVELNNTDEFGVELGFQDDLLFDRSVTSEIVFGPTVTNTAPNGVQTTTQSILSQESAPGFNFNQPATLLGNNAGGGFSSPATVGKQALSNFQMGRINGDLGFGGLVLSAGSESVNILLRALAENRKVEVLSRPLIQSLHNQPGTILVGQQFQQVTGASAPNATGFSTPQFALTDVGIQLNVTPNISPEGTIVMEVLATKSRLSPTESVFLFQNQNGTTVNSPVIDTSTAQATVSLRDGQTIVLGGMITKTEGSTTRKVPWLADLPLLGSVFRYDSKTSRRTELLIFLTPRIMRTPEDYEEQKQIEAERMSFMAEEAEKLHGPLFALPKPKIEIKPKSEPEPQGKADKAKKPGESSADAAAKKGSKKGSSKKKNKQGSKKKNKQGSKKRGSKKTDGAEPQAASTTIDGSDSDAALFALPGEVEGIESGVPVEVPPPADRRIKRFFGSLIP